MGRKKTCSKLRQIVIHVDGFFEQINLDQNEDFTLPKEVLKQRIKKIGEKIQMKLNPNEIKQTSSKIEEDMNENPKLKEEDNIIENNNNNNFENFEKDEFFSTSGFSSDYFDESFFDCDYDGFNNL